MRNEQNNQVSKNSDRTIPQEVMKPLSQEMLADWALPKEEMKELDQLAHSLLQKRSSKTD